MPPYLSHYQFAFTNNQRDRLRELAGLVRAGIEENRSRSLEYAADGEPERIPLAPLDQLLAELAKFTYNLDEPSIPKVSLSARLLILFLFELMQKIDRNPAQATQVDNDEYLGLHYFLSFDLVYYHTMHDYHGSSAGPIERPRIGGRRDYVNTAGMNEVAVFTALYNVAKPKGRGFLQDDVRDISEEEGALRYYAQEQQFPDWEVEADDHREEATPPDSASQIKPLVSWFDYVDGRAMKISRHDLEKGIIDVTTFNEYNGQDAAQRAVAHLPRA
jgi:hypothetical protein